MTTLYDVTGAIMRTILIPLALIFAAAAAPSAQAHQYQDCEVKQTIQTGRASWYGEQFHGRKTASGEKFDMNAMTAAHKTLGLKNTWIKVENLDNGQVAVLRVNDRGPYHNNRVLDVSKQAAQALGFRDDGTAKVQISLCA